MCAGGKRSLPQAQIDSSIKLSQAIRAAYGFNSMLPHGIFPNRKNAEGILITNMARQNSPTQNQKFLIEYSFKGKTLFCKVDGVIPPCTTSCDNTPLPSHSIGNLGPSGPFSSPYTDGRGNFTGDAADWGYPLRPSQQQPTNPLSNLMNQLLPKPLSPQPQPSPQSTPQTTNQNNTSPDCSDLNITNYKTKKEYYLNLYNKSYFETYGSWDRFLEKSSQTSFSFDNFFASFYAKQVKTFSDNLQKCNQTSVLTK
jgi:hypothetical protein